MYTKSVRMTMMEAENKTRYSSRWVMMGASLRLGGFRITVGSTGSTPNDWLGGPSEICENEDNRESSRHIPSMRMLINRICMAFKGLLSPKNVLNVINVSAAAAVLSWKVKKFWMLWKIDLPEGEKKSGSQISQDIFLTHLLQWQARSY